MTKEGAVPYSAVTDDVYAALRAVIGAWRPDLANFEIDAQFVPKSFKVAGRLERATAVLPPERYARWCPDVIVELAEDAWGSAGDDHRKALLDHALAHVAVTDGGQLVKATEDAAVFTKLYQRHGAYTEELRRLEGVLQQRVLPGTEGPGVDDVAMPARGVEARADADAADVLAAAADPAPLEELDDADEDPFAEDDDEDAEAPEPEEPVPQVVMSGPEHCACCGKACGEQRVAVHGLGGEVWPYCSTECLVKDTQRRSHEPGGVLASADDGPMPDDEDFEPDEAYVAEVTRRLSRLSAQEPVRRRRRDEDVDPALGGGLEYATPAEIGEERVVHVFKTE